MFFVGFLAAVLLTVLVFWLIRKGFVLKWYDWLIGALAVLSLFAAVQHYFSSLQENEPKSAWMGALIFGVIFIILAAINWQLVARRNSS